MNKLLTLAIIGLITITGCASTPDKTELAITDTVEVTTNNVEDNVEENRTEDGYYISPTDNIAIGEVITNGSIMEFDNKYIHIISGDLVEVFEYENSNEMDFYIGQNVQLVKGEKINILEAYEREDFTITHTNMGHSIDQMSGTLIKIANEMITVKADDKLFNINIYEAIDAQIGDEITVYTVKFGGEDSTPSAIMTLNENNKLFLTITEITRSDEGVMNLFLTDNNDGRYTISASNVSMELDMIKLAVDDKLTVYYKGGIMESDPMQLDTVLIRK